MSKSETNQTSGSLNDCFLHDKERLRHDEALAILQDRLAPIVGHETIALDDALGRVVAADIHAPHPVPNHTNAAVDGYAFAHSDLNDRPLNVSQTIAAGDIDPKPLEPGTAARIFTGAAMPEGADTVAMQEDCDRQGGAVTLPAGLKHGANCRLAGEDIRAGQMVIERGHRLKAADLAALASIGCAKIDVFRPLRVAVLSSGNELRTPQEDSENLRLGEVFDTNTPLLAALLDRLPVVIHRAGIVADTCEAVETTLSELSQQHDVIITSGGASRGDEDHMLSALDRLGKRHLWQLAVKPGRPMMFGQISRSGAASDCIYFGLPGNPVAAMVCFLLYVRPSLLRLAGAHWSEPQRFPVPAGFSIKNKKPDRREFLRGSVGADHDGKLVATRFERDGSGLISSLRLSDGLIEIPEHVTEIAEGEIVSFIPFTSFD
ncbi:MAG: gephyrin-like molybdotransferase Glp [Pseudomonadota bacterium]